MKEITLKAKKRTEAGKKYTKKIRKQGFTPAIVYGGNEPIMCEIETKALKNVIYTDKVYIINLDIDGEIVKCIKKDAQFHPVSDLVLHLDFLQVFDDKDVKIFIPVKLTGFAEGVKQGGHLYQLKRYILVKGKPAQFPDELSFDITKLTLGKSLKISEVTIENLEVLEPASDVIAMVKLTRAAMSQADEEEGEGEGEGEETSTEE